jgi:hypothetical protein
MLVAENLAPHLINAEALAGQSATLWHSLRRSANLHPYYPSRHNYSFRDVVEAASADTVHALTQYAVQEQSHDPVGFLADVETKAGQAAGLASVALPLLKRGTPEAVSAGAGLLYIAAKSEDFTDTPREAILREAIQAFGLPADIPGRWALDGQNTEKPWRDGKWAQNANFEGLCLLELERPGAARVLANSPFRLTNLGRFLPEDIVRQYDTYVYVLDTLREGKFLQPWSYVLSFSGLVDWNGSGYASYVGSQVGAPPESSLKRIGRPLFAQFGRPSHMLEVIRFLASVHGVDKDTEASDTPLVPLMVVHSHADEEALSPDSWEGSVPPITAEMVKSRFPDALSAAAAQIGLKDVVISGCNAGVAGSVVQQLSAKVHGVTFHGSQQEDALVGIERDDFGFIWPNFLGQGRGVQYLNGRLANQH